MEDEDDNKFEDRKTNRQKLNYIAFKLYRYCRDQHDRTYSIIRLLWNEFMSKNEEPLGSWNYVFKDKELSDFFRDCLNEYSDPRMNSLFQSEWPNLDVVTKDDENEEIKMKIEKFVKIIPILYEYSEYL